MVQDNKYYKTIEKIYGYTVLAWCYTVPYKRLWPQIPARTLVRRKPHKTSRPFYEMERKNYRIVRGLMHIGQPIEKRAYLIYRAVAEKYGWDYIKEN